MVRLRVLSKGSGHARRVVLSAAAKVNLALEVLGKRPDGYHELATVMQAVDLSDRLGLRDADDLELVSRAPGVPTDATNLAWRAAVALREAARLGRGVRITLDKRIPVAAGLGGGSTGARGGVGGGGREPLRGGALALVLVNPGIGASTAGMYGGVTPAMYSDGGRVRALGAGPPGRRAGGAGAGAPEAPA